MMLWYPTLLSLLVGVAIIGVWIALLARGEVSELRERPLAIRFHLAAELLTALLLVAGALALWTGVPFARPLSAAALGAALYTTINSAGYYADRGERPTVVMFVVLAFLTAGAIVVLLLEA